MGSLPCHHPQSSLRAQLCCVTSMPGHLPARTPSAGFSPGCCSFPTRFSNKHELEPVLPAALRAVLRASWKQAARAPTPHGSGHPGHPLSLSPGRPRWRPLPGHLTGPEAARPPAQGPPSGSRQLGSRRCGRADRGLSGTALTGLQVRPPPASPRPGFQSPDRVRLSTSAGPWPGVHRRPAPSSPEDRGVITCLHRAATLSYPLHQGQHPRQRLSLQVDD